MATTSENEKQIETIQNQGIETGFQVHLFSDIAISTHTSCSITQKNQVLNLPNRCFRGRTLDVSGFAKTLADGQNSFRLTEFLCPVSGTFGSPINILVTPSSAKPCYVTVMHEFINNGEDVKITFFSWDSQGGPFPDVFFHWRCRVEFS